MLAFSQQLLVHAPDLEPVYRITGQVLAVTRSGDLYLAEHLADDNLEVLVMDVLALRAIYLLNLNHQVHLAGLASLDAQHAMRVE